MKGVVKIFKRTVCIILILAMTLLFGCANRENSTAIPDTPKGEGETTYLNNENESTTWQCKTALPDENTSPPADEISQKSSPSIDTVVLSAYKAVLQGNAEFFETDIKKMLNINLLSMAVSSDSSVTTRASGFSVVDLDDDGTSEVVLWLVVNGNDNYGSMVLRYQDGVVYGYVMWYRSFNQLKADGTFHFSSSAGNSGIGKLTFDKETYSIFKVAYREANYGTDGNPIISYIVNNETATKEEFDAVYNKQDEKPDTVWYDFTDDNIEKVFSGLATGTWKE
jgi:hypothetical protein